MEEPVNSAYAYGEPSSFRDFGPGTVTAVVFKTP